MNLTTKWVLKLVYNISVVNKFSGGYTRGPPLPGEGDLLPLSLPATTSLMFPGSHFAHPTPVNIPGYATAFKEDVEGAK